MLKEIVFRLLEFNLSKIIINDDRTNYKNILTSKIHPAIQHYIKSDLKFLFYKDKLYLNRKSVFNYLSNKINFFFEQIFEELQKNTFLTTENVKNLLLQSISFNLSHLIKPNWSLKKLIFNDKKDISLNDFSYLLEYAYYYPYQKRILLKYFNKQSKDIVEVEKFDNFLIRLDKKLFQDYKKELLIDFFNSFLNFTDISADGKINFEIILTFLNDKKFSEESELLKQYSDKSQLEYLTLEDFKKFLESMNKSSNFDELGKSNYNLNRADETNLEDKVQEKESDVIRSVEEEVENQNMLNNLRNDQEPSLFEEEHFISNNENLKTKEHFVNENNKKNLDKNKENLKKNSFKSAEDFLILLSSKEIKRIEENLFNSDTEDFINVIETLISPKYYEESLKILDNIIKLHQLDTDAKELSIIKEALKKYYGIEE